MIRFTTLFCKNRAGSVAAAIAVLLLLAIAGCFHLNPDAPGTEKANIGWNLKSRNTKVLLLTHLGHESFSPPVPPPRAEGLYHLKIRWLPGQIRFDAAVLTELLGNQAGQSHREKVIQVVIISPYNLIAGKRGEERFHPSQLDEAEARDLDIALSYFSSMATKWAKKKPYPNQELTYVAKGSLRAMLSFDDDRPAVFFWNGNDLSGAALAVPAANIADVQSKLRAVLKELDAN